MIIASATRKGGVLKTSITVNLAGVLSRMAKKVLIIDTDPQGDCLLSFNVNPDKIIYSLFDVLVYNAEPMRAVHQLTDNIYIIPSNDDMISFDFEVIGNPSRYPKPFELMREKLGPILHKFDYILIDSPGHFGLTQGNILNLADKVIIPFQPEVYSMRALTKIISAIREFKEDNGAQVEIAGVVGTMVDSKTVLHSDILAKARQYCLENDIVCFETVISKSIRYASSVAYNGVPATLNEPDHPLSQLYTNLAEELINNGKEERDKQPIDSSNI